MIVILSGILYDATAMEFSYVKFVVYVPITHADSVREALAVSGAGKMGMYDSCSFSTKGVGRFKPMDGAKPFVGEVGKVEEVEEERIETVCSREDLARVMEAVLAAHPYEEPAIDVYPLLNLNG